jgi:iron complex outermembrane receptor protein
MCLASVNFAADSAKFFDIEAGDAATTLKQAATQAGVKLAFSTQTVRGVQTSAVKGELPFMEALGRMLAGTDLVLNRDDKSGGYSVDRLTAATKGEPIRTAGSAAVTKDERGTVKMQEYSVLGTRIRQADVAGPSPVSTYDLDYIRSSGAFTLSDFLRTLPQTYNGVGAGRNSAPDDLNMAFGQRTENVFPASPTIGGSPFLATNAPVQTGVSGVSLRGLGSGSTLVLVDGRRVAQAGNGNRGSTSGQGFVDLNTIPLGLIERVEIITDGASAIYGADAVAGVINIVLKKSWSGTEVSGSIKMTEHGGGRERQSTITTGFAAMAGRLRGTIALNYYDREPLVASQRAFTKDPDFRTRLVGYNATTGAPVYGTDQRIQWGYPASIQAVAATGFVSIPGVRVLLAPEGSATTPPVSAFEPRTTNVPGQVGTGILAQGQRVTNPAQWTQLVAGSERYGITGSASYQFSPKMETYGTYSFTDSRSSARTLPAYVANVLVSAANNPFRENIQFGMMLPQWGQVSQQTKTQTHSVTVGLRGEFGRTWRWDSGYRWQDQKFGSINRSFNQTAFNALANNADPTQRFNPFIDERSAGAANQSALLEQTAIYPKVDARSGMQSFDISANGDLFEIPGGPIRIALGGSYERSKNDNTSLAFAGFPVVTTVTNFIDVRNTRAAFGELSVPLFGKPNRLPLLERLEVNMAGRYENISDAGSSRVPKYGFTWQPIRAVLFRGSYSEGFRAPSLTEDRRLGTSSRITFSDPFRGNQSYAFDYVTRPNPNLRPETSTNEFYGVVVEPPFVKRLSLSANYYRTEQRDAIQQLGIGTSVNNSQLFPDLVIRGTPSAADIALNYLGPITTLYAQSLNFGLIRNESLDLGVDYRLPWEKIGKWRLGVNAAKTLKQTRELSPGSPPIDDSGDTYASPRWNVSSSLFWNKGPWSASTAFTYISGYNTNRAGVVVSNFGSPSMRLIDLRGSYEFKDGVWRGYGKGARVGLGIANLEDQEPPFYNNIYGFNAGLHGRWVYGRTYEFSVILPF